MIFRLSEAEGILGVKRQLRSVQVLAKTQASNKGFRYKPSSWLKDSDSSSLVVASKYCSGLSP